MSLSTRVIAGIGAVVVVGAATLGGSIAWASGKTKPASATATITIGRSSHQLDQPTCFDGGKPLSQEKLTECGKAQADVTKQASLSVNSSDRIGVGVDKETAKRGWRAGTNGGAAGSQSGATLAAFQTDNTFSGLQAATSVLTSNRNTTLTVIGYAPKSAGQAQPDIVAVWLVNLVNDAAPAAAAQAQDPTQGQ